MAQFFLKPFPLEVKLRHVPRPTNQKYFETKSAAIIGGLCKNTAELLDKILLVNQLIDQISKIYLVGEIGLAAVSALLDTTVSKVDHNNLKYQNYFRLFHMLFTKAQEKGCDLVLPVDFCTALKINKTAVLNSANGITGEERPSSRS